jgi:hypothetical protein
MIPTLTPTHLLIGLIIILVICVPAVRAAIFEWLMDLAERVVIIGVSLIITVIFVAALVASLPHSLPRSLPSSAPTPVLTDVLVLDAPIMEYLPMVQR